MQESSQVVNVFGYVALHEQPYCVVVNTLNQKFDRIRNLSNKIWSCKSSLTWNIVRPCSQGGGRDKVVPISHEKNQDRVVLGGQR